MHTNSLFIAMKKTYQNIQHKKPLILNITNQVTMSWVANVELAVGTSPIMSVCHNEFADILQHADALYINLGTLDESFIEASLFAASLAKKFHKPMILDPVGCGFTQLRTKAALKLLPYATVVRGNASEIVALCKYHPSLKSKVLTLPQEEGGNYSKGVDASATIESAVTQVQSIVEAYHCICVVTGKKDVICSAEHAIEFSYGSELMAKITGMGCALGGVLAAFLSCHADMYKACIEALLLYTLTAQQVARVNSLGQFSHHFLDALHSPNWQDLQMIYESEVTS